MRMKTRLSTRPCAAARLRMAALKKQVIYGTAFMNELRKDGLDL
jgi:hypothetical protein